MTRTFGLWFRGGMRLTALVAAAISCGCATTSATSQKGAGKPQQVVTTTGIQNLAPDEQSPVQTTGVNPGDIEPMAQKMVRSILSSTAVTTVAVSSPNGPVRFKGVPRIALRPIKNTTSERFDPELITARVRNELIRNANGQLEFIYRELDANVAGIDEAIKAEQRLRDSGEVDTGSGLPQKTADFFLMGEIREMVAVTAGGRDRLMQFSFYLVNTNTSAMVWGDDYQIRRASVLSTSYRGVDK